MSLFFLFLDRVHIQSSHTTAHIYLLISSLRVGCHGRGTIINTCTMYSKSKVKRWYRLFMPRSVSIATLPGSHLQCPVFFYAQVETLKPKRSLSCSSYLVWSFYILYFLTLQCLTAAVDDPWPIGQGS